LIADISRIAQDEHDPQSAHWYHHRPRHTAGTMQPLSFCILQFIASLSRFNQLVLDTPGLVSFNKKKKFNMDRQMLVDPHSSVCFFL
jgi:hypothetical protein